MNLPALPELRADTELRVELIGEQSLPKYKLPVEITASTTFPRTRLARSPNPACGNGSPRPTDSITTIQHP